MRGPDGDLGLGSGWLTHVARLGDEIDLRLRSNRNFHAPDDDRPMILIGNGTGLAGLRAAQGLAAGRHRNWLVFGERQAAHDWFCRAEIEGWRDAGGIERLDAVFSRDQEERRYVQHLLREQAGTVRAWIDAGAAVTSAAACKAWRAAWMTLRDILGDARLQQMQHDGRYRRDVLKRRARALPATRHAAARRPYCNLIWALSITLFQRSRSAWICAPNSAGVLPSGKAPVSSIFAAVAGSRTACAKACASLSRTSSGRPAGATTPYQAVTS